MPLATVDAKDIARIAVLCTVLFGIVDVCVRALVPILDLILTVLVEIVDVCVRALVSILDVKITGVVRKHFSLPSVPFSSPFMGLVFDIFIVGVIVYVVCAVKRWIDSGRGNVAALANSAIGCVRAALDDAPSSSSSSSYEGITARLRSMGVDEIIHMAVALDYTESNKTTGARTFGGRSLHYIGGGDDAPCNPYERAMSAVARVLLPLDSDKKVPLYAFGDTTSRATGFRRIGDTDVDCRVNGADAMVNRYRADINEKHLSGPTNFAPIINEAARIARELGEFHVLIIICDGQVTLGCEPETVEAIRAAARTAPLAIITIGVGDGPWDEMRRFDNDIHAGSPVDNFHFVPFDETLARAPRGTSTETYFAAQALAELPRQYRDICKHRARTCPTHTHACSDRNIRGDSPMGGLIREGRRH
jgi:hypothetical protein